MFQMIILRNGNNQPFLVEFIQTSSYTFWHYHGNAEMHSTNTILQPYTPELEKFCQSMQWKVVAIPG